MTYLRKRRLIAFTLLLLAAVGYVWFDFALKTHFRPAVRTSGLFLFGLMLFLTLFNARKKLPFIPVLKASTWMQFHIYLGYFTLLLFFLHMGFQVPQGGLEITVAILFLSVSLSGGVLGAYLSRSLPVRLTHHGENMMYERIPGFRYQLAEKVEALVVESVSVTSSSTLADFYREHLREYFERPHNFWSHLRGSQRPLRRLLERLTALDRYLNADERKFLEQLTEQVRVKDNMDFQWYLQGTLKIWLFVHIPLTYALLMFAAVHGLLAWKFT